MHFDMHIVKFSILFFSLFGLSSNVSFAHHEQFYPINWDSLMEYDISKDAFSPVNFKKYPFGFVSAGCERTMSIITTAPYDDDKDVISAFKKKVKAAKVSQNLLAYVLLCDAMFDIRHPPEKGILQYQKMERAYKLVYDLSVELTFGGQANPVLFLDKAAMLTAAAQRSEVEYNPDQRTKWLRAYFAMKPLTPSVPANK